MERKILHRGCSYGGYVPHFVSSPMENLPRCIFGVGRSAPSILKKLNTPDAPVCRRFGRLPQRQTARDAWKRLFTKRCFGGSRIRTAKAVRLLTDPDEVMVWERLASTGITPVP